SVAGRVVVGTVLARVVLSTGAAVIGVGLLARRALPVVASRRSGDFHAMVAARRAVGRDLLDVLAVVVRSRATAVTLPVVLGAVVGVCVLARRALAVVAAGRS